MDPFRIKGIDHVVLRVSDPERSIAFYRDALGCEVERRVDELGLIQLRAGSSLIDLVDLNGQLGRAGGDAPDRSRQNVDHFALTLDRFDAEAISSHLAQFGVESGEPARRYGAEGYGPSIYLKDPDGNTVELKGPSSD